MKGAAAKMCTFFSFNESLEKELFSSLHNYNAFSEESFEFFKCFSTVKLLKMSFIY